MQCLEAIQSDPEVEVLRLKNRLDPDYHSILSGGYRSLSINLRIVC